MNTTEQKHATETLKFSLTGATTCRIKRRAELHGRTDDEEALALLQGKFPDARLPLANECWAWELEMPAELAQRIRDYAKAECESVEEGFSVEHILIETLDAAEDAEAFAQ